MVSVKVLNREEVCKPIVGEIVAEKEIICPCQLSIGQEGVAAPSSG